MSKCPLCGGSGKEKSFPYATKWDSKDFEYIRCGDCKTVFVNPVPDELELAKMYKKENYHDKYYGSIDLKQARRPLRLLNRFCANVDSVLDFGCGNGSFLKAASYSGFSCVGVEYDEEVRKIANQNSGSPVYSFPELKAKDKKFGIIHLGDVLEHLQDPRAVTGELCRMLMPGGFILVESPLENNPSLVYWCAKCFRALKMKLKKDTRSSDAPLHLFQTNARALENFLIKNFNLRCLYSRIYETGWPYILAGSRQGFRRGLLKGAVGVCAVILSRLDLRRKNKLGNRYLGLFQYEK